MKGWRTGRKKTEYILLQCSRVTVKARSGSGRGERGMGKPPKGRPRTNGAVCERTIRNGKPCGESQPLCASAHEKVGCGRGTSVPDRESEELLCKDQGEDIFIPSSGSFGNRGRFLRWAGVRYPLFRWDGGFLLPGGRRIPGGHPASKKGMVCHEQGKAPEPESREDNGR